MTAFEDESLQDIDSKFGHSSDGSEWVPLSLVLVEYQKGDLLGKQLAIISLTPFAIIAGFLALILFRRDLHTIAFFLGHILNEATNLVLKHTFCEVRPMRREVIYTEYGMPSAHSQFMWFFTTYVILFVCFRLHYNNNSLALERFWRTMVITICVVFSVTVGYSRIYLQYHSSAQVVCGAIVGIALGIVWFLFVHLFLSQYFPVIVSWKTSEYLLLRDTTLIPNVLWFEYTSIRTEARARSRKLAPMKSQ